MKKPCGNPSFAHWKAGVLAAFFVFSAVPAMAGGEAEFYVNTYRSIGSVSPRDARSKALGGAGRGLADGVGSLGVNPAALGAFMGSGFDVGLGYDLLDDANQTTFRLGGAVNLDRWHPTGGVNQAVGGLISTQNHSGVDAGGMKRDQTGVLMAYGLQLTDDLLGGVSVALFDGKWKGGTAAAGGAVFDRELIGGDFKVGGLYRFDYDTTIGGSINYAIGSHKEGAAYAANAGAGDLKRYGLGVGAARRIREETLVLGDIWFDKVSTDVPGILEEDDSAWGLSIGVEQQVIPEIMALRGGLYYDRDSYSGGPQSLAGGSFSKGRFGITAGVGVKLYSFDLGYALDVNSGGDVKNQLDLSAEW